MSSAAHTCSEVSPGVYELVSTFGTATKTRTAGAKEARRFCRLHKIRFPQ
jgi:hypothetical protein